MDILTIDGWVPDVDITSVKRTASMLDGPNAGRLKNGSMSRDVIGTYYNYEYTIYPNPYKMADYDTLWEKLTAPVKSHKMIVPFAQSLMEYDAYITEVSDGLFSLAGGRYWKDMAFTATAIAPQRYYGESWKMGSGNGNAVFTIDGIGFNVGGTSLQRTGSVLDGAGAGRALSGVMERDIIGTYYNYSLTLQMEINAVKEYDNLYYILTAPVDSHKLVILYGQTTLTFDAYVSTVTDNLLPGAEGLARWSDLTVDFVAMHPERRG